MRLHDTRHLNVFETSLDEIARDQVRAPPNRPSPIIHRQGIAPGQQPVRVQGPGNDDLQIVGGPDPLVLVDQVIPVEDDLY